MKYSLLVGTAYLKMLGTNLGNSLICLIDRVMYYSNANLFLALDCNHPKFPLPNSVRLTPL